jgi:hypothetical protein
MSIYRGNLSHSLGEISNKADWLSEAIEFYDDASGTSYVLADATEIYFEIKHPDTKAVLVTASLTGGSIEFLDDAQTLFRIVLAKENLTGLCAGQYLANLSFTLDGMKHDPVLAEITVFEGAGS